MIDSLLYLTAYMPGILFSIFLCSRFQSDPRQSYLTVVKRIFRYIKGTTNLGLIYKKSKEYKLVGYCDVEYSRDRLERNSTSGICQFLGDNLTHGPTRDNQQQYYQQLKQNILSQQVVAHKSSG